MKIDKNNYMVFKKSGKWLHQHIYESYEGKQKGVNIHHIDKNTYNNDIWNLIAIPWKKHKHELKHGRISFGNWDSGIKELKRIGLTENDFPEEVIKRLRNQ